MDTPWGTGAQTPIRRPTLDDATYELMKDRSHLPRRRSSYRSVDSIPPPQKASTFTTVASFTFRGALLFSLGVGYGAMVSKFHHSAEGEDTLYDHAYFLAFWGVAGVVLGALLPWFDKFWEETFGGEDVDEAVAGSIDVVSGSDEGTPGTDWALVMRAIGAFVGIVFAIVSTHVSLSLISTELTLPAQTPVVVDTSGLHYPGSCKPSPLVAHRPLESWLSAIRRCRSRWIHGPPGRESRHDAHAVRHQRLVSRQCFFRC